MMRNLRRFAAFVFVLLIVHICAPVAFAHPLGNFTTNHYAGLHVRPEAITIDYVLDMAEIPAFQEIDAIDANRDGQADAEERAAYHPAQCEHVKAGLALRLNGRPLPLSLVSSSVEFPPGQGGLLTLRLTCFFGAFIPSGMGAVEVTFENHAYSTRLGWREIVVSGEEVALQGEFSTDSLSRRLTAYPEDLLTSPLDQRRASFQASLSAKAGPQTRVVPGAAPQPAQADQNDAFTRLILLEELTLPTLLLALLVSFAWGAMHALTPGHGKTIVGAYLVGARGTAKHALYLGLTTTITHTAGVFVLGIVTLFAAQFIMPEKLFPWLSFVSGLLVVGIGANLFIGRLRAASRLQTAGRLWTDSRLRIDSRLPKPGALKQANPPGHPHGHHHPDDHGHPHDHQHPQGHYPHDSEHQQGHHHPDDHDHPHDHHHSHPHERAHAHQHGHDHRHHDPLPPGADGTPVTWRSLLALGISGGLLPCPSALVVLLGAIALDRVGFGLVLVFTFSLGLAGVLSGIGLLFVYAGRIFNRLPTHSRLLGLLPAMSALFITLVGLGITARALLETGLIN